MFRNSCNHYKNERFENIYLFGIERYTHYQLQYFCVISDLADIILEYTQKKLCMCCLNYITWISHNSTIIVYNNNYCKYLNPPTYKTVFIIPEILINTKYIAPEYTENARSQIIKDTPMVRYKNPGKKSKSIIDQKKIFKKLRSSKLYKKDRPLGYKNIENNFNLYEYESFFEKDLYIGNNLKSNNCSNEQNYDDIFDSVTVRD